MKSGAFAAASFMYWWRSVCAQLASELHPEVVPAAPAKYDLEMFEGARYVALGCDLADEVREIRDHAIGYAAGRFKTPRSVEVQHCVALARARVLASQIIMTLLEGVRFGSA